MNIVIKTGFLLAVMFFAIPAFASKKMAKEVESKKNGVRFSCLTQYNDEVTGNVCINGYKHFSILYKVFIKEVL